MLPVQSNNASNEDAAQVDTEQLYASIEDQEGQERQLLDEHHFVEWNPDRSSFILALIAMSPFVSYICYKMELVALPYLAMLSYPSLWASNYATIVGGSAGQLVSSL